jgi:hypothetical protein
VSPYHAVCVLVSVSAYLCVHSRKLSMHNWHKGR